MAEQMNQFPNPGLDSSTLAIASLAELPKQPVNLSGGNTFLGSRIQQIKVSAAPPVLNSAAPLTITRRSLGGGVLQFRVQFIAPTQGQAPNYQTTSILVSTPNGTQRLAASSGAGPIVFNSTQTTAPASVVLQQDNSNASSKTGLGTGSSRALVQL
jgi:hypothetical protein